MKKLEELPATYEQNFTKLTKGVNESIREWIIQRITPHVKILEVGCGPGTLAYELAKKGCKVIALDQSVKMIESARTTYGSLPDLEISFFKGNALDLTPIPVSKGEESPSDQGSYDSIVSTFMLSELRPLEQQIFLRTAWTKLAPGGTMYLAAEFVPTGFSKIGFSIKRWWYRLKMRRRRLITNPLRWFMQYLEPIGFALLEDQSWIGGSIRVMKLQKTSLPNQKLPGYYTPSSREYTGIRGFLGRMRCVLTGQVDHVSVEPGIYPLGNPTPTTDSPILVSCNYLLTYIILRKKWEHLNAWLLCVDSRGINVWCAARGPDFGNSQILEAIRATNIGEVPSNHKMILPQLAAGGVELPKLTRPSQKFPFEISYGPVWAKDVPKYIETYPKHKPASMNSANFDLFHRLRAGVTHAMFLYRKIFFLPLVVAGFLMLIFGLDAKLWVLRDYILSILVINLGIAMLFPLSNFSRKFILKGFFFGALSGLLFALGVYLIYADIWYSGSIVVLYFWTAYFSTMSFSGYTFATSPREIANEYKRFSLLNRIFLASGTIIYVIGIIFI
ncbi:MAG: methyltransferase domain-containing protein [Promethearchaeota archaeon]